MKMTHVALAATLCLALPLGACGQENLTEAEEKPRRKPIMSAAPTTDECCATAISPLR